MSGDKVEEYNPGQQLQFLLREIYPPDSKDKASFVQRIDNGLIAEGDFDELVYNSCINYVVRRLITTAEFFSRQCEGEGLPDPDRRLVVKLRKFVREETHIPHKESEKVLDLLLECLRVRGRQPTPTTKKRIRRIARDRGMRCYICGRELDFDDSASVTVDHKWPNALGGADQDFNLKAACSSCNSNKADYMDASDFHYEEICLVGDKGDGNFRTELCSHYRVALLAKSDYSCVICGKPSAKVGELRFARRNLNDSWHFINVDAYCGKHAPD